MAWNTHKIYLSILTFRHIELSHSWKPSSWKCRFNAHRQYHGYCCPGHDRSQVIDSLIIELLLMECFSFSTKKNDNREILRIYVPCSLLKWLLNLTRTFTDLLHTIMPLSKSMLIKIIKNQCIYVQYPTFRTCGLANNHFSGIANQSLAMAFWSILGNCYQPATCHRSSRQ